ncbi:hypothetical protein [Actinomadura rupiterrae]|uniref:hypothetical protein n=1 Tax=Actinomadura rupiterrae TaxID=559627 RepID=UPI0020A3941E|nr:hypothetical protein [Actinomadura rupiterrae]MCP2342505.1 hypothetical protein [Actinomadura rupiterrae]
MTSPSVITCRGRRFHVRPVPPGQEARVELALDVLMPVARGLDVPIGEQGRATLVLLEALLAPDDLAELWKIARDGDNELGAAILHELLPSLLRAASG